MSRFYLNVADGPRWMRDPQAYEFDTLDDAREAAVVVAREVVREQHVDPARIENTDIVIADDRGRKLATVRMKEILHLEPV